jgi:alkylation response protein AidB-like acyl-CoA dehydrogenase
MSLQELTARFAPVFAQIAEGAVHRETERGLPFEAVRLLADSGFTAVRVPRELGGGGATDAEFFELLIQLGAADSNLPQLLRAHFSFVEERINDADPVRAEAWLRRAVDGQVYGNAATEIGSATLGVRTTTVSERPDGSLRIDGTKHYSTGSLFADWIGVFAVDTAGAPLLVLTDARGEGVELVDNWDGFGQRLTGSGTTNLVDVTVQPENIVRLADAPPTYSAAFVQAILLASLAGIGRAIERDAVDYVRSRRRTYSHASADLPREDPLVQQVVGQLSSLSLTADSLVLTVARAFDALNARRSGGTVVEQDFVDLEILTARAQPGVVDAVLRASTLLFEVGGASAVQESRKLDRHWRNARTLSVHNPVIYKHRVAGDHLLNGTLPPFSWQTGVAASAAS